MKTVFESELNEIKKRYSKRKNHPSDLYNPITPYIYMIQQEKERALIAWINKELLLPINDMKLLEIGCGNGTNLIQFMKLGFDPEFLFGNELLPERIKEAKKKLPPTIKILEGNALELNFLSQTFDIVYQSMVFSSILNNDFQQELAYKMWEWTKVGGGVLWYDFTFDNPNNKDVKGVKFKRVKELFPEGKIKKWKLTLAPPLARGVTKIHPSLYTVFNAFPFLRTHILCWIKKTN